MFGAPISLTHEGSASYKTTFGGCLSMALMLILGLYTLLKFREIMGEADWMIEQQIVSATKKDLLKVHQFQANSYENLSLSLQFKKKRGKMTKESKMEAENTRGENRRRRRLGEEKESEAEKDFN